MSTPTPQPESYTHGLGEMIRAHRLYVGLSQYGMAAKLGYQRRQYQRIESDRDACPPGLMTKIEQLTDEFDTTVDAIIEYAKEHNGANIKVEMESSTAGGQWEWERNAAGRAAMLASGDDEIPAITITIVGKVTERTA